MVLILPGKSPRVFCITKKAIHQILIEQAIHMSPRKTGLRSMLKTYWKHLFIFYTLG